MSVCANCGDHITIVANSWTEKVEYVRKDGGKRIKSVPLREVCTLCAVRLGDSAKLHDHPAIAAMEVVDHLRTYMGEPTDANWQPVNKAMGRYMTAGVQEALDLGAV